MDMKAFPARHPALVRLIFAALAAAAVLALYTFVFRPRDLRAAAGLSGVEAEQVAEITVTFPWPGYARTEDPALIARALALLEDTAVSRRSYGHLVTSGDGNPWSVSFALTDGTTVSLREAQRGLVFDREAFAAGLAAIADRCESRDREPHETAEQ